MIFKKIKNFLQKIISLPEHCDKEIEQKNDGEANVDPSECGPDKLRKS